MSQAQLIKASPFKMDVYFKDHKRMRCVAKVIKLLV